MRCFLFKEVVYLLNIMMLLLYAANIGYII
jgi:hypothetical protein